MGSSELEKRLVSFFDGAKADILGMTIRRGGTTLDEIRDAMLDIGVILEEDLEQGIYVARVTGGRRKAYGPIIAARPSDEGVDVAGVIVRGKQKPVVEAFGDFEAALDGNPPKPKSRHGRFGLFILLMLIVGGAVALSRYYLFPSLVIPAQAATIRYNEAVEEFNAVVPMHNDAADGVDVENLRGFVREAQELTAQGTDYASVCKAVIGGNKSREDRERYGHRAEHDRGVGVDDPGPGGNRQSLC